MKRNYDEVAGALKRRLPAATLEVHGRLTEFIRRMRTIGAADFVWSVVLSRFASGRPGFDEARGIFQRLSGLEIWPRPFQMRFKAAAAVKMMQAAFETAVEQWRRRPRVAHPLAQHFTDIVAIDSTIVQLHDRLRSIFPGHMRAAAELKATLALSVFGLVPLMARLTSRKIHDSKLLPEASSFRAGTLLLFDNAYAAAANLDAVIGGDLKFIAPMRINGAPVVKKVRRGPKRVRKMVAAAPEGVPLRSFLRRDVRVKTTWDLEVLVPKYVDGRRVAHVSARLVILPGVKRARDLSGPHRKRRTVPCSYYYLTNVDARWSGEAIAELYRLRWQIELVFKELKQSLSLESVPTKDANAAQVLVWASLVALAVSRTIAALLTPLRQLNGLAAKQSPALISRALHGALGYLVLLLSNAIPRRFATSEIIDLIARTATRRTRLRVDSFQRLLSLAPA
jgi:Transposase DDE domain